MKIWGPDILVMFLCIQWSGACWALPPRQKAHLAPSTTGRKHSSGRHLWVLGAAHSIPGIQLTLCRAQNRKELCSPSRLWCKRHCHLGQMADTWLCWKCQWWDLPNHKIGQVQRQFIKVVYLRSSQSITRRHVTLQICTSALSQLTLVATWGISDDQLRKNEKAWVWFFSNWSWYVHAN